MLEVTEVGIYKDGVCIATRMIDPEAVLENLRLTAKRCKFVGQIVTVDGNHPGTRHDSSWKGDLFKVLEVYKDHMIVLPLLDLNDGFVSHDGIKVPPRAMKPVIPGTIKIDTTHFIVRLVTPEEVIQKLRPCLRTWDDINRIESLQRGYRMTKGNPCINHCCLRKAY